MSEVGYRLLYDDFRDTDFLYQVTMIAPKSQSARVPAYGQSRARRVLKRTFGADDVLMRSPSPAG